MKNMGTGIVFQNTIPVPCEKKYVVYLDWL